MNQLDNRTPIYQPLSPLEQLEGYCQHFMDLQLWEPYVRWVCDSSTIGCSVVKKGKSGTYPTFIVDERWVIKFFGQQFEGQAAFKIEQEAARLVLQDGGIPVPKILQSGRLFSENENCEWPYLIFEYLPGTSIGDVWDQIPLEARQYTVAETGQMVRRLHNIPLDDSTVFAPDWSSYLGFMKSQREKCADQHREWGEMPVHLIDQIDAYLLPAEDLIDFNEKPFLIHADITRDHLLGTVQDGKWQTAGLIDFGDAMVADLYYELVALHLDLFDCDRRLLQRFLVSYGHHDTGERFMQKAMCTALLHRWDAVESLFTRFPPLRQVQNLEELAIWLWDVNGEISRTGC
jgi:hygromycin-B 7''-O-kinase